MGELLQRSINESIRLEMQLSEHLWVAEADPNQLESALLNLVINARDAMPDGGKLVVETTNRPGRPLHRSLQQPQPATTYSASPTMAAACRKA
jgi:signal transduction histidine kinase